MSDRAARSAPEASPLVVAIDFKQPESYLAHGPTRDLAASCGITIDWRPFPVPPLRRPPPESPGADRSRRHVRLRARYVENDLRRYAAAQGLVLRDIYRSPDPSLAGMGLLFAKRAVASGASGGAAVDSYVERVFTGYWNETLDIEDLGALRQVLTEVGVDAAAFGPDTMRGDYDQGLIGLREAGVILAPAYLVGDELFIGRAHLPMVRWLLEGKAGPPPV
jgi:2-hydroxychromene-2-carboxylate isomerase